MHDACQGRQSCQRNVFRTPLAITARTRFTLDRFGSVQTLYVVDDTGRRYTSFDGEYVLAPGNYKLVFTGSGDVRVELQRLPFRTR